ncbi:MAG: S8 family serine peptidase [Chitinophagaceae bacterium]|nr:S8 family serine peptidase [Chitinophagaceae bacterium]
MKHWLLLLLLCVFSFSANSQFSRYRVTFKHKGAGTHQLSNPSAFLSERAIQRRVRYNIAIDSTDLPVPAAFIQQIQSINGVTVLNQSKWLNAVTIQASDADAIQQILSLTFVLSVDGIAARSNVGRNKIEDVVFDLPQTVARQQKHLSDYFNYGANSFAEIALHNGQFLHNIGLRGQQMQIAMLDGGFRNYHTLPAFDSMNKYNRVLSTWDFVDRNNSVSEDHQHGMQCLSTIAANIPGQFVGKAPEASFHLFRTEDVSSEFPIEEFNWVCGAERADSIGADIISSSLGYGYDWSSPVPDYPYSDLNGDITMAARGADMAAAKGMLVFNSAGNSGNDPWKMISTPADGDSVVAVGAVNNNRQVGSFSSYGPSADGRIKPDVASVGVAAMIQNTGGSVGASNGTSYACPNMAGLATCLWQGFPEVNNMRIVRALKESADRYTNPDDRTGYGIPDLKIAFSTLLKEFAATSVTAGNCSATLNWKTKEAAGMKYIIERRFVGENNFTTVLTDILAEANPQLHTVQKSATISLEGATSNDVEFRVIQVIDTAQASYSTVILDTLSASTFSCPTYSKFTVQVTGQPTRINAGSIVVRIEAPEEKSNLNMSIISASGQIVYTSRNMNVARGLSSRTLAATIPTAGIYWLVFYEGKKVLSRTSFLHL